MVMGLNLTRPSSAAMKVNSKNGRDNIKTRFIVMRVIMGRWVFTSVREVVKSISRTIN